MKIFLGLLLVSCLAVGHASQLKDQFNGVTTYSLVDEVIRALLNNLRKDIATIEIPDIEETFTSDFLNASFSAKQISHENLENFEIVRLQSGLLPLKISNLTLSWKNIKASAFYDFDINADRRHEQQPTKIFGKGLASASLNDITFTIGANLEQKQGNFQIKPAGLFGFDLTLRSAEINLESLMGNEELGKAIGQLISDMLPVVIEEFKRPLFDLFRDDLIEILNQALRGSNAVFRGKIESSEESQEFETFPKDKTIEELLKNHF